MKKVIFTICILAILFNSCHNHSTKVVIDPQLIKKFYLAYGNFGEKLNYRYESDLSIFYGKEVNDYIFFSLYEKEKTKNLWIDNNGCLIEIDIKDNEMGFKEIKDPDDEIAQKIISDFTKIMEQTLIVSDKLKRVDKIFEQDFLSREQISTLKATLFCRENLKPTNFFSKKYFGMDVYIDEPANLASFECNGYLMITDYDLNHVNSFYKKTSISGVQFFLSPDNYRKDSNQEFRTCSISEEDLISFEEAAKTFKNIITEKIGKLNNPVTY